jgi:hypothetical protein
MHMISTRNLSLLPGIDSLRRLLQSMAMLDAILCPEWQYCYYSFNSHSFNSHWSDGEQMGSMRDGIGNDFFSLFNSSGCWLKGFAHEAPMNPYRADGKCEVWPGIFDTVPRAFANCLVEPAFKIGDTTFCIWRTYTDPSWMTGEVNFPHGSTDPDGSRDLLSPLDGRAETYHVWAEGYYERDIHLDAVRAIYAHQTLSDSIIAELNPEITLQMLAEDVAEIGYMAAD